MDQEEIDKVVLAYLDKRGFKQAGLVLQQEKQQSSSKGSNASSTAQIDPDIAKQILSFSEYELIFARILQFPLLFVWLRIQIQMYFSELVFSSNTSTGV